MKKLTNKFAGLGVLSAITASLCCITPVLAFISGASGMASAFSWMEPARPYMAGLTILVLAFAWYQKLKPKTAEEIQCDCEEGETKSFMQGKLFLGMVTFFALIMLAFPRFAHVFYPSPESQKVIAKASDIQHINIEIEGMTCAGCEQHVQTEVQKLPGVFDISVSYANKNAVLKFDQNKTDTEHILEAVKKTGYTVKKYKIKN